MNNAFQTAIEKARLELSKLDDETEVIRMLKCNGLVTFNDVPDKFKTLEFVNKCFDRGLFITIETIVDARIVLDASTIVKKIMASYGEITPTVIKNIKKYGIAWLRGKVDKTELDKAILILELSL